jgi:hypothetical protein
MIRSACTLSLVVLIAGCGQMPGFLATRSAPASVPVVPQMAAFEMDVPFEATVPFGTVARVCAAEGKSLGQLVAQSGDGNYSIYDSGPEGLSLRKFYLTGLSDGCPRQFMAATAVFGSPSKYEELHLGEGTAPLNRAATDAAYEDLKLQVCGAAKGEPCGRKMKKLERSTVFVSAYELAEENERWTDILIHDGAVLASALKSSDLPGTE